LYQVGAKTLRLVITGDGADKGPYIADADLTVVEETLSPDWWQWVAPASAETQPTVKWKEKYKIAARALNHAQSDMRFESSLFELPPDVAIWKPRSKATNMIAAGKVADVVFTDEIEQDWQWIIPGVWIVPAQVSGLGTTRAFDYKVNLSLTDGFGNGYDPFDSGLFRVYVKVSDVKVALGWAAEAHMVIANLLTVAGLLSVNPWVLGAGGSAATEAQALGAGALDPPDPDPLFREAVEVSLRPAPVWAAASDANPLGDFLQTGARITTRYNALLETEGRLMGARLAGDAAAVELQKATYRQIVDQITADADSLPGTVLQIGTDFGIDQETLARTVAMWQLSGLPSEARDGLLKAGTADTVILALDQAVRTPEIAQDAAAPLAANIGRATVLLATVVNQIRRDMPGILDGATGAGLTRAGSMAQVASGGAWTTSFTLLNAGAAPAQALLNFFDDNGNPLPLPLSFPQTAGVGPRQAATLELRLNPGASLVVETKGPESAPTQVGWAELLTDGGITGFAVFQQSVATGPQAAVVPLDNRDAASYLLTFDNTGGFSTGVALANAVSRAATIEILIRDSAGAISLSDTVTLAAQGHTSFNLADRYIATAQHSGTVEFRTPAGGRISVLGLRFSPTGAFTTVPAVTA
jgi:hypothetical protein